MPEIVPSILSANFARLAEEIAKVEEAGVRMIHIDVMDGHFVPNITVGVPVVESIRKATKLTLDVHLMIEEPDRYVPAFVRAGADHLSVHVEACRHLDRVLRFIQSEGAVAGVVLNPATPVQTIEHVLEFVDYVLVMSVNPGFGGQKFIPYTLGKVKELARLRKEAGLHFAIEIDGGINRDNVAEVVRAGCDWIVAGASIFETPDPTATAREFQKLIDEAATVKV